MSPFTRLYRRSRAVRVCCYFLMLLAVLLVWIVSDDMWANYTQVGDLALFFAFLFFAAWTLRGDELTDAESDKARTSQGAAILAVGVAFFLAELGDKTMLATITLATTEGLFGTWLGSTLGMVAADALAILVGRQLGARLPERAIRIGAAITFFVFAAVLFVEAF